MDRLVAVIALVTAGSNLLVAWLHCKNDKRERAMLRADIDRHASFLQRHEALVHVLRRWTDLV